MNFSKKSLLIAGAGLLLTFGFAGKYQAADTTATKSSKAESCDEFSQQSKVPFIDVILPKSSKARACDVLIIPGENGMRYITAKHTGDISKSDNPVTAELCRMIYESKPVCVIAIGNEAGGLQTTRECVHGDYTLGKAVDKGGKRCEPSLFFSESPYAMSVCELSVLKRAKGASPVKFKHYHFMNIPNVKMWGKDIVVELVANMLSARTEEEDTNTVFVHYDCEKGIIKEFLNFFDLYRKYY